jgi:hypothetical protein
LNKKTNDKRLSIFTDHKKQYLVLNPRDVVLDVSPSKGVIDIVKNQICFENVPALWFN